MHVIDAHAHIFPDKIAARASKGIEAFYDIPVSYDGSLSTLLELGAAGGIEAFLVQSVATVPQQVRAINNFIADCAARYPDKLIGFGALHPGLSDRELEEETEYILSLGLHGVKLHPDFQKFCIDDPAALRIYDLLQGRLPLLIHTGDYRYSYSHPARLAKVLREFPRLDVIAAHFGGWSQWKEAEEELAGKRVFVDTSSAFYELPRETARRLIAKFSPEHVLFGSDYPMWEPGKEKEHLFSLGLTEDALERICFRNVLELLGLSSFFRRETPPQGDS